MRSKADEIFVIVETLICPLQIILLIKPSFENWNFVSTQREFNFINGRSKDMSDFVKIF